MAVQTIVFEFDGDSLFGSSERSLGLDIEASANKFAQFCKSTIQNEYPEADVDVLFEYDPERDELLPRSRVLLVDGETDSLEAGNIESVIERVYNQGAWMLQPHRLTITDAAIRSGVPEIYLQWMCERGLMPGAINTSGIWELSQAAVNDHLLPLASTTKEFGVMRAIRSRDAALQVTFGPLSILDIELNELSIGADILVVQHLESLGPAFIQNSRFVISLGGNQIEVRVEHLLNDDVWNHPRWRYEPYVLELLKQAQQNGIECGIEQQVNSLRTRIHSSWFSFSHHCEQSITLDDALRHDSVVLIGLGNDAELALSGGPVWNSIYETNERLFCLDVLKPLLEKLGFSEVNYRGGPNELGKDFTFSELTVFGEYRFYGLQAKAGDISGRVNSSIDEIIGQLGDAFEICYKEGQSDEKRYISHFIVAVSGYYTGNAETKIREKIPKHWRVAVSFWDKTKIQWLIRKAWLGHTNTSLIL